MKTSTGIIMFTILTPFIFVTAFSIRYLEKKGIVMWPKN